MKFRFLLLLLICSLLTCLKLNAQPEVCGPEAEMTSFCMDACVICDIDGFTGNNSLIAQGQGFSGFCTTEFNNMQYIAFIAGTTDLTIRVDVGTCVGGLNSLEVGFFQSLDCQTFDPITNCDTDIPSNTSETFSNSVPLVVGQYYYLVMDGSNSANCDWTFNVIEGSTEVLPLEDSGEITHIAKSCPGQLIEFTTTGEFGAADYAWTIDDKDILGNSVNQSFTFPEEGIFEICVTASNVCDQAPTSCSTIEIRTPETLFLNEILCQGDCIEVNGKDFCEAGFFEEIVTLDNGCDSLIEISIEVLDNPLSNLDVWICNVDSFQVGNSVYTETGSYLDTVLTSNNCDSLIFLELLTIECEIIGVTEEIPALCNGTASGVLIFSVEQGTPPLTFTYTNIADGTITGTGMTNLLVNNQIPGVPAGTYQIFISDNFGNDVVVLQDVTEPPQLIAELIPSDFNGFNVSCFSNLNEPGNDGSLFADANFGTPPYTYLWDEGQTSATILGLRAQTYTVQITDANECTIERSYTLTSPPPIVPSIQFIDPNCDGKNTGRIIVDTVLGGTPGFQYALNDTVFSNNSSFSSLVKGEYEVFIEDENGCIEIVTGILNASDIPQIFFEGDSTICLGDSLRLEPILSVDILASITWDVSTSLNCLDCLEPFARPFDTEIYTVHAVSADSCIASASVVVTVDKKRRVYIANTFTPNDDGVNDFFYPFGAQEVEEILNFKIYDRWGERVYEAENFPPNDPSYGWDGNFKGRKAQSNVYAWTAVVLFLDGEEEILSGTVTIIR